MKKEQNLKPRKIDPILVRMENEQGRKNDWTMVAVLSLALLYFAVRLLFQS